LFGRQEGLRFSLELFQHLFVSAAAGMWMKTAGLKILSLSPIPARLILGFVQRADNGGASHDSVFSSREDFQSSPVALAIDLFNVLKVGQSCEH
jgi:hypothetical protein